MQVHPFDAFEKRRLHVKHVPIGMWASQGCTRVGSYGGFEQSNRVSMASQARNCMMGPYPLLKSGYGAWSMYILCNSRDKLADQEAMFTGCRYFCGRSMGHSGEICGEVFAEELKYEAKGDARR
jgi:hypothetical protein